MAKTSVIQRNKKRERLVARYAAKRQELKAILADPNTQDEAFYSAQRKLAKLPRNSSAVRLRNRCPISGRPRAFYRKYQVSRLVLRELALQGRAPGVTKSSW